MLVYLKLKVVVILFTYKIFTTSQHLTRGLYIRGVNFRLYFMSGKCLHSSQNVVDIKYKYSCEARPMLVSF